MDKDFLKFLKDISDCFIERDVRKWRGRLLLPFSIITRDGPVPLVTEEAVVQNFLHYLTAIDALQLDLIDRTPVSLENCNDGTWLGTFQTRLLTGDRLAVAPYTSTALLQVVGAKFQMSSMLNGRGHDEWTGMKGV